MPKIRMNILLDDALLARVEAHRARLTKLARAKEPLPFQAVLRLLITEALDAWKK